MREVANERLQMEKQLTKISTEMARKTGKLLDMPAYQISSFKLSPLSDAAVPNSTDTPSRFFSETKFKQVEEVFKLH